MVFADTFRRLFDRRPAWMKPGSSRFVDVGWLMAADSAGFIWYEPRRVKSDAPAARHAKSASFCPAVVEHEARIYEIACPIDARLSFRRDEKGVPVLANLDGDNATIRGKHLNNMLAIVAEREWRHPDRPMIQLSTPYVMVADEPVYAVQVPPLTTYNAEPWPGVLFGGRMPIHIWPRQLMWAFEWHDTSKPLILRRGEPWFNILFETHDPSRPVRVFEAQKTPALEEHMKGLAGVSNYVNRTFSLFKVAEQRRPAKLLERKQK